MSVRISASDWKEGGIAEADLFVIAEKFREAGCDLIDVSSGQTVPDQIAYIIFDSSVVTSFMPTLFPPIGAPTIAELAVKLALDPAALEKTIADFNAAVQPGTFDHTILDDCRTEGITPAKTHWARKIEHAPYLAYPVRPGITFTYLGTRVTKQSRMVMKDGKPSANMFAAGEIMAGNVLGKGYAAGIGMTIGSVFGRVAGREAAKNAKN